MLIKIIQHIKKITEPIEIRKETIKITKELAHLKTLKIVQLSDLHINSWNIEVVESCIEKTNSLNPDIILISGDVICNGQKFLPDLLSFYKKLKSRLGIYACLGNHDYSDGADGKKVIETFSKAEIKTLNNESESININDHKIWITGLDDLQHGKQNLQQAIEKIDNESLFMITHNPKNFIELAQHNPIAVFAGHTHGGQIYLPFLGSVYEKIVGCEYLQGRYEHNNSVLYVNRGIGTAMLSEVILNKKLYINTPRFNSRPEITVFEFDAAE